MRPVRAAILAASLLLAGGGAAACSSGATCPGPTALSAAPSDGCAPGGPTAVRGLQPAHRGGTLRVLARASAGPLDPQLAYSPQAWQLLPAVYDGLMAFAQVDGPESAGVVPDLAAAPPAVEDGGKRYVFRLRTGVRFSTGAVVTPDDVAASLRRAFRVGAPAAASAYRSIVGAEACLAAPATCTLAGGVAVDTAAGTVTVRLVAPDPDLPAELALPAAAVLPAGTPDPGPATAPPPGTGAYRIASYDPARSAVLRRNPHFAEWSRAAQPDGYPNEIVEEFGHDPGAALEAVRAGTADLVTDDPAAPTRTASTPASPSASPSASTVPTASTGGDGPHVHRLTATQYLALGVRVPPFDHPQAREAVARAVDRAAVAHLAPGSAPACTLLPPGVTGYRACRVSTASATPSPTRGVGRATDSRATDSRATDVEEGRRLVTASGTAGQRVRLVVADDATSRAVGAQVVTALRAVGYRASLRVLPADLQYRYVRDPAHGVQIALTTWFGDYPAPRAFLPVVAGCTGTVASPANLSGFCDPALQAVMDRATALAGGDRAAADRAWAEADAAVVRSAAVVPLITPSLVDVVSRRVGNYQWSEQSRAVLSQLWVR